MLFDKICKILNNNQIGYHIQECENEFKFIYIDHGRYGRPKGLKIKKNEFRPDFRISVHDDGRIYTKDCGWTSYMTMEEILEKLKG